jgi:hypothetical protein
MGFYDILKNTVIGFTELLAGIAIGTIIDIMFYKLYKKIDPTMNNNKKLVFFVIIQTFLAIFVYCSLLKFMNAKCGDNITGAFFSIGFLSTQIFIFEFTMKRFGHHSMYNLDNTPIYNI